MMTRMSSAVGPEALSRRERISSGLSTMILRDSSKMGNAASSRRERLLGVSPPAAPSLLDSSPSSDFCELKEEDIWGVDDTYSNPSEESQLQQHHLQQQQVVVPESDQSRLLKSGKQWIEQPSPLGLSSINRPASNAAAKDSSVIAAATGAVRKSTTTTASRMIPQVSISSFDSNRHQSAPVNIPDWSKILRVDKRGDKENGFGVDEEEEELDDATSSHHKLPPHLLVAREYAKSHTAFSVYEGAGRTLKGMDLSRVRNAVWKQTGFIGG